MGQKQLLAQLLMYTIEYINMINLKTDGENTNIYAIVK